MGFEGFNPMLTVVNSNLDIINEVRQILEELEIGFYHYLRKSKQEKHKDTYSISVGKISHLCNLLPKIIPYLIGKKRQGELELRFVKSRNKRGRERRRGPNSYSKEERETVTLIRELNKTGKKITK